MQLDSLEAWLAWLEQNHPREIDLGLERVARVAARMQLLKPLATVVTVAGTNGKGSCVASTAALLHAAGYRVGVYTSPHLIDYNERIAVGGKPVSDAEICAAFSSIYAACHQPSDDYAQPVSLTYFEYGTLAALEIFRRRNVTAMVLEVGLGGRLDAVNIIDADIAVITSIALDHTDWLGDTRDAIGREKAGIMRPGKPVVCADLDPPTSILEHALQVDASLYVINRDFGFTQTDDKRWNWWSSGHKVCHQPAPHLPLPSVAAALQVAELLGVDLRALDAFSLVARLAVPGRFQIMQWNRRVVILDVAHNPAATAYLAERLAQNLLSSLPESGMQSSPKVHGIVAMMSDKDHAQSLANLKNYVHRWYVADLSAIPRAASVGQLQQSLMQWGVNVEFSGDVASCLREALTNSNPDDRILIFGSFFTVAAGLKALDSSTGD